MMIFAKGLPVIGIPEQSHIPPMWFDVVNHGSRFSSALFKAFYAKWVIA
jgi:hypothetical protein